MKSLSDAAKVKNLSRLDEREKNTFKMLNFIYSVYTTQKVASQLISYFLHVYSLVKTEEDTNLFAVTVCYKLGRQLFKNALYNKKMNYELKDKSFVEYLNSLDKESITLHNNKEDDVFITVG